MKQAWRFVPAVSLFTSHVAFAEPPQPPAIPPSPVDAAAAASAPDPKSVKVAMVLGVDIMESDLLPPEDVVAWWKKQGRDVAADLKDWRTGQLRSRVAGPLAEKFARENDGIPTEAEIALAYESVQKRSNSGAGRQQRAFTARRIEELRGEVARLTKQSEDPGLDAARKEAILQQLQSEQYMLDFEEKSLLPEEREKMNRRLADTVARNWKFARALHKKYGGKVIWQQMAPLDPVEAWPKFLKDCALHGDFAFANEADAAVFWASFPADTSGVPIEHLDLIFRDIETAMKIMAGEE